MIAPASVLLPEPFGPISACVSPRRIVKSTPLRIGFPSTATCKFLMANVSVMLIRRLLPVTFGIRHSSFAITTFALRRNLLVIKHRLVFCRCRHITAVMRHGQLVLDLAADLPRIGRTALLVHLVALDLVLDSHEPFQQRFRSRWA